MSQALVVVQKLLFLGCCGILIENFFTGVWSLVHRHWKLTTSSYGWMFPIYSLAGFLLDTLRQVLPWPFYVKALVYLPLILGIEAMSGLTISRLTRLLQRLLGGQQGGAIPWTYNKSAWAPLGLVNLKYLPFWGLLCLGFDPLAEVLSKIAVFLAGP